VDAVKSGPLEHRQLGPGGLAACDPRYLAADDAARATEVGMVLADSGRSWASEPGARAIRRVGPERQAADAGLKATSASDAKAARRQGETRNRSNAWQPCCEARHPQATLALRRDHRRSVEARSS
jgi:hypothetical protein